MNSSTKDRIAIPIHPKLQYGLGDVLRTIYRKNGWFSRIEDASKDYEIFMMVCSHNQHTFEIFRHFDYINAVKVKWYGHVPNYTEIAERLDAKLVDQNFFLESRYECKNVTMLLDEDEQRLYDEITTRPVIFIHPFAGDTERMPIKPKRYVKLIEKLRSKTDDHIVVCGGSFRRGARLKHIAKRDIKEEINIPGYPGVYNLVNKTTPRLPSKLVEDAKCFFGNWSAYCCAAWEKRVPVVMFTGPKGYRSFMMRRDNDYRWHKKCVAIDAKTLKEGIAFQEALVLFEKLTNEQSA